MLFKRRYMQIGLTITTGRFILKCCRKGDVAHWLERLTASPVMHASRFRTPLFPCGVFRETSLFLPCECD